MVGIASRIKYLIFFIKNCCFWFLLSSIIRKDDEVLLGSYLTRTNNIMPEKRIRDETGKFIQKSATPRKVRSIRLTDEAWEYLGKLATQRCITRADLIEEFIENGIFEIKQDHVGDLVSGSTSAHLSKDKLNELMESALKLLKVGKQSKYYKDGKKALQYFINELLSMYDMEN